MRLKPFNDTHKSIFIALLEATFATFNRYTCLMLDNSARVCVFQNIYLWQFVPRWCFTKFDQYMRKHCFFGRYCSSHALLANEQRKSCISENVINFQFLKRINAYAVLAVMTKKENTFSIKMIYSPRAT